MKEKISKCISTIFDENSLEICEAKWKTVSQTLYNHIKNEEKKFGIPPSKDVLPQLFIDNMTAEQIWQQIEFQNELVIAMKPGDVSNDNHNLCIKIAELCNKASDDVGEYASDEDDDESDDNDVDDDDGSESASNKGDDSEIIEGNNNEDDGSDKDSLSFLDENEEDINKSDEEDISTSDEEKEIDFDKDTFNEIAMPNDESDEEEEEQQQHDEDDEEEAETDEKNKQPKKFTSSIVDSQFFNLRQSEWIADNDLIGKSVGDDIDLMEDVESDEEDENDLMYDNFFDPATQNLEERNDENEESENNNNEANESQVKSKFAAKLEEESALKKGLEEETYLAEKPWIFKGEVQKSDRPENSTLEHHLETTVAVRIKPTITDEVNRNIEGLILTRIKEQSFDDVERKIKPVVNPARFKEKLILDQEKSSKSLTAIYEEEYMKKQQEEKQKLQSVHSVLSEADEKYEELPSHKNIKREMKKIFMKLEALFNYHYTPKYTPPEVKVIKNVKAISIEESTPAAVSDATLLAPQEIVAPIRGELKGKTEKDKTDKNRERRSKKKHQKLRARREENKLIHQMKKRDKNGLLQTDASIKFVQKAVKKGQIKLLDNKQKPIKSATAFFNEMQNVIENGTKKRKTNDTSFNEGTNKKKRKNMPQTVSKLLL